MVSHRPFPTGILIGALVAPAALGVSTAAVALPELSEQLALSPAQAVWVLAGYVLANAMAVAIFGRLGDIRGVRPVLLAAGALIAAGSLVAALSGSFALLIGGRLLQGAGVGGLPVAAFAIVGARFEGAVRAQVLVVMTGMISVISGSGALIGGGLTDVLSWRAVVAVPALSLLAVGAVLPLAPEPSSREGRVDVVGAVLVAALASALVLLLETPSVHFPGWLLAALGLVALSAAAALARRMRVRPDGFIPARVVRSRRFVLGTLAQLSVYCAYLGLLFAAPPLLLSEHDWSPTQVGLVMLPAAACGALGAQLVNRLLGHRDAFRIAAALALASAVGMLLAGAADGSPVWTVAALSLVLTGFVASQAGLVGRVPLAVDASVRSVAAGIFTLVQFLGGAMGSAAVAGLREPLGLAGAVACLAIVPAIGALLALAASRVPPGSAQRCPEPVAAAS